MKTIKVVLKKEKKEDKHGYVKLRITNNRIPTYKSLKIRLEEKYWMKTKQRVSKQHPNSDEFNDIIEDNLKLYYQNSLQQSVGKSTLLTFFRYYITTIENQGSLKKKKTEYNRIITYLNYLGIKDIKLEEITKEFVVGYLNFLKKEGLSLNTRNKYIKDFRTLINKSINEGEVSYTKNPFQGIELKNESVRKRRLNKEEVKLILNLSPKPNTPLFHTKNGFLFQIFGLVMRVSDMMMMRWGNVENNTMRYRMFKTKTPMEFYLNDNLIEILFEYIGFNYDTELETDLFLVNNKEDYIDTDYIDEVEYPDTDYSGVNGHIITINRLDEFIKKSLEDLYDIIQFIEDDMKETHPLRKKKRRVEDTIDFLKFVRKKLIRDEVEKYSENHKDNFIFPFLNEEDFKGINETPYSSTKYDFFTQKLYGKLMSSTTKYNKQLKVLQTECGIKTTISSHVSRHTITEIMLSMGEKLYTISKSLGHKSFSVTQNYMEEFNKEELDGGSQRLSKEFEV